jgi:Cu+-exporting ATPase
MSRSHGDQHRISAAHKLSQDTITNMKQNPGIAFVYNALSVPLVVGVLFPLTGWLLSAMIAALAMRLSPAPVVTNALRLRETK